MKLVSINRIKELWNDGVIPSLAKKIDKTKILTTEEQVTANTSNENVASAPVVKSLINDLTAMTDSGAIKGLDAREDGVYITYVPSAGADPVTKKLGSPIFRDYTISNAGWHGSKTITFPEHHPSYPNTTYVGVIGYTMNNVDIQFPSMTLSGRNMYFVDSSGSISVTVRYMEI